MNRQQPQWIPPQSLIKFPHNRIGSIIGYIAAIIAFADLLLHYFNFNAITGSAKVNSSPAKVGNTITVDNASCTLESILTDFFVAYSNTVTIKLVNNTGSDILYSVNDFHIKDEGGNITDANSLCGTTIISGGLAPNGHVEGNITFIVQDQHNAELLWQPGDSTDLSHTWKLGL